MNLTICQFKRVVSWVFCTIALSPYSFGQQALPSLIPVNVPNFTLPFEIRESTTAIREVELLVSQDRGKRWYVADRQTVETGKFAFRADSNGEYWFDFRIVAANGSVAPTNGLPQRRVLVNAKESTVVLPSQQSKSGPLTPPKPERYRIGNEFKPQPVRPESLEAEEQKTDEQESVRQELKPIQAMPKETAQVLAPKLPGFVPIAPANNHEGNLLDDLLSGMSPFMDIQPVEVKKMMANSRTAPNTAASGVDASVGSITGIRLNPTRSGLQIVVMWNAGHASWQDAQIDVFRGESKEGEMTPIAINLPNSGEYWWFLTPEDLKPFHITVRIRSMYGEIREDVTQSAITIDPKLSQSPFLTNLGM